MTSFQGGHSLVPPRRLIPLGDTSLRQAKYALLACVHVCPDVCAYACDRSGVRASVPCASQSSVRLSEFWSLQAGRGDGGGRGVGPAQRS